MRRKFPWAVVPNNSFAGSDEGWWHGGFDSEAQIHRRMIRLVDWLESLRDTLPASDVVFMVTHGDQTHRMLNVLLARLFLPQEASFPRQGPQGRPGWLDLHPKSNTSTSCITMNPGEMLSLDFFNRTDHLGEGTGPDTLMRGYQYLGLDNRMGEPAPRLSHGGNVIGYWGLKLGPTLTKLREQLRSKL
eukprot:gnl/TRDRNA2_/TRDRNA2_157871_c0_seq1.p2 gnl/TRDRNA2_/TRDRNA2_157871_c0~~gnl/TRDRNA2_/TRDRNA2_157871_c0_seq1.p2  ORF type:complete len:188 (+),score=23.83 gnl/TRDRNA2_/TRDRNA2_157871_c0_seq1:3-566(+)